MRCPVSSQGFNHAAASPSISALKERSPPVLIDPTIQDEVARAAETLGVAYRRMPSGGGHDAAAFSQAGIPACMLFVRNQHGSHNPHEAMRMEDFATACTVVTRWAAERAS